jgi:hypothetical protein
MADLTTLDPLAPPGGEDISLGDDRIRETRAAILGSFGIEHNLSGVHKIPNGAPGALPASGNAGRVFIDTTNGYPLLDTGSAWNLLKAVGFVGVYDLTDFAFGTTYVNVASATVVVPNNCTVLGFGLISLITTAEAATTIYAEIDYGGGNNLNPKDQTTTYPVTSGYMQKVVMAFKALAAGTYTFNLRVKGLPVAGTTNYQVLGILLV